MVSSAITEDGAQEIHVYDSMYATVVTYTKKQIASIVSSSEKEIKLKMMNVQKQNGGCDCGLFAIAFATALANGIQPGHCFFQPGRNEEASIQMSDGREDVNVS